MSNLLTRVTFLWLIIMNVFILAVWVASDLERRREEAIAYGWVPASVFVWIIGLAAIVAADKPRLALVYFLALPVAAFLVTVIGFASAKEDVLGLVTIVFLLALFDAGMLRVFHELMGSSQQRKPMRREWRGTR